MMRAVFALAGALALAGCVAVPTQYGGMVSGSPGPGYATGYTYPPCCRVSIYAPAPAVDYLSDQYYYYGPTVDILFPSMIYGYGWAGRGYYHVRPNQRYMYGQEHPWHNERRH